jgi:ComF family protein
VRSSRVPICKECWAAVNRLSGKQCSGCGLGLEGLTADEGNELVCPRCREKTYGFDRARGYGLYQGELVRAILMLKFEQMAPLREKFADWLEELVQREPELLKADIVVPVPLHRQREKDRGLNQAAMIAKPLARLLKLPYQAALLVRTRPRPNKQILNEEERWALVRGAFATRPGSQVDKRRVLLVDDVLTTGATLVACAGALREAGAKAVIGLTVARAVEDPKPRPGRP